MTDRTKTICPPIFDLGGINRSMAHTYQFRCIWICKFDFHCKNKVRTLIILLIWNQSWQFLLKNKSFQNEILNCSFFLLCTLIYLSPVLNVDNISELILAFSLHSFLGLWQALLGPVRIRVRIDPPHPLVCCKRRLNGAVLRMRPKKPRPRVTAGVAR